MPDPEPLELLELPVPELPPPSPPASLAPLLAPPELLLLPELPLPLLLELPAPSRPPSALPLLVLPELLPLLPELVLPPELLLLPELLALTPLELLPDAAPSFDASPEPPLSSPLHAHTVAKRPAKAAVAAPRLKLR